MFFVIWLAFFAQEIPSFPPEGYSLKWFQAVPGNDRFVSGFILSLQVALILRTLLAFQVFSAVLALIGRNLPVLSGEAYFWYSTNRNPNVAAAFALLIMTLSLVNTGIYLRALRVRDEQVRAI